MNSMTMPPSGDDGKTERVADHTHLLPNLLGAHAKAQEEHNQAIIIDRVVASMLELDAPDPADLNALRSLTSVRVGRSEALTVELARLVSAARA